MEKNGVNIIIIVYFIVRTTYATEADLSEPTTIELEIAPLVLAEHEHHAIEDPLLVEGDDDIEVPTTRTASNTAPAPPPKRKKQKGTHQDIQVKQFEVSKVEKYKIGLEVENLRLVNEKLRLEIEAFKAKSHSFNIFN